MRALWSDRQNCSHKVSRIYKRIKRFSDFSPISRRLMPVTIILEGVFVHRARNRLCNCNRNELRGALRSVTARNQIIITGRYFCGINSVMLSEWGVFLFSEADFKTFSKIPLKRSIKITSRGYIYFFEFFGRREGRLHTKGVMQQYAS